MHFTSTRESGRLTGPLGASERIIHLVDPENLVGGPRFTAAEARLTHRGYVSIAPAGPVDMTILATSHFAAASAWLAWPRAARRLVRSGADGADLALLHVIEHEDLHGRFDRVVIGSGDGIFAMPAARLQELGCQVTVVSRRDALSRQLRFAVRDVRFIDWPHSVASLALSLREVA
jgi:hypothetical protein